MTESVSPALLATVEVAAEPLFTVRVGAFITPHTKPLFVILSRPGLFSVAVSFLVLVVKTGFEIST